MASAAEHAETVFSAIIPNRRDLLERALRRLTVKHFPDKLQANIFSLIERYYDRTTAVMSPSALSDMLRNKADSSQALLYQETYEMFASRDVEDSDFSWAVDQLRELASEKATAEAITESMEILRQGKTLQSGDELRGHEDARDFLLEELSNIDKELSTQETPEGDMRMESDDIMAEYAASVKAREEGNVGGVKTGISELDAKVGGLQRGELVLAAGYSSDGKTTLCTQVAWSAAVEQGKNVVFLTTETVRSTVRRKLVSRHSLQPQFGLPEGFNNKDLKAGTLSAEDAPKLHVVLNDLRTNPTYGRIYIAQVPRGSTIQSIESRLYRLQHQFNIDLVIMDYLGLMVPPNSRNPLREDLAKVMREAKQVSTTFNDGLGIPFMSPWQVSRHAREEAEKMGIYTSASLSETAEATNSADVILSLLAPTDNTNRRAEITMQILKNRDGETSNGIMVDVDYATSRFQSKRGPGDSRSLSSISSYDSGGLDDLQSLI